MPLTLVNRIYNKHVIRYQKELHDRFESLYDVFETKDIEFIRSYFQSTAKAHQKIANWGAVNFSTMRLVLLGVFLMVLHISIDLNEFTTGDIYAIVAYLWTFVSSSEYLPDLLESWTSIKEVSMCMKVSDEEMQALTNMLPNDDGLSRVAVMKTEKLWVCYRNAKSAYGSVAVMKTEKSSAVHR